MNVLMRQLSPSDPESVSLIAELDAELSRHYPREHMHGLHPGEEEDPRLRFFVFEVDGVISACGALRELEPGIAELKRMFVRPSLRGKGYGRVVLTSLEREAAATNLRLLRLETGTAQREAIALYRSAGFSDIPPYGEYVGSPVSVCMEKRMPG
jgi:putative acetyltransferase